MDYDKQIQLELSARSKEGPFTMGKTLRDHTMELVIRVLVAEDNRLHTQLLADALRRDGAFEVSFRAGQIFFEIQSLRVNDIALG